MLVRNIGTIRDLHVLVFAKFEAFRICGSNQLKIKMGICTTCKRSVNLKMVVAYTGIFIGHNPVISIYIFVCHSYIRRCEHCARHNARPAYCRGCRVVCKRIKSK